MQEVLREGPGGRLESRVTGRQYRARVMSSIWRPIANVGVIIRDHVLSSLLGAGHE